MVHAIRICAVALSISVLSSGISLADSKITISLAGEAFEGPPKFEMLAAGKVIASGLLTKAIETETSGRLFSNPRPSRYLESYTFTVADKLLMPNTPVEIILANDKFSADKGLDRNLFIDTIEINGLMLTSADLTLLEDGEKVSMDYQAGFLPVYQAQHRAVAEPPAGGWPKPLSQASSTPSGQLVKLAAGSSN